jgi:hypothetical protein
MRHSSSPPSPWALDAASQAVLAELAVFTYRPDKMKRFSRPKMSGNYAKLKKCPAGMKSGEQGAIPAAGGCNGTLLQH